MLRRRPHSTVPSWLRHPSTGWLVLAALYLTATVVNVLLAIRMVATWPIFFAGALAGATAACVLAALGARQDR